MNKSYLALFAMLAVSPGVLADTKFSKETEVVAANEHDKSMPMQSQNMQEKMLRMHEQMHKIMQTKDGVTRERLIQEHRTMIDEHMRMMHSMKGNCMEGKPSSKDM